MPLRLLEGRFPTTKPAKPSALNAQSTAAGQVVLNASSAAPPVPSPPLAPPLAPQVVVPTNNSSSSSSSSAACASAVPAAVPTAPREDVSVLDVTAELTSELDDADCLEEATDGAQQDYLKAAHWNSNSN